MRPEDRFYLESHEWAKLEGDTVTIGITDFAIEQLGELVYLDLPDAGDSISKGENFGEVESVKAVSDLSSPVEGEISEVNTELADNLAQLQEDPFGNGWLLKLKVSGSDSVAGLLDAEAYEKLVESVQ
ncbi:MAG: glycine cleavage system protein GcvH [Planctomycetota bacterium]|jgi:glycine cleavage system H protein|nr:glycine cleavage system protein GcvH [Planctomycetota bacterium]